MSRPHARMLECVESVKLESVATPTDKKSQGWGSHKGKGGPRNLHIGDNEVYAHGILCSTYEAVLPLANL